MLCLNKLLVYAVKNTETVKKLFVLGTSGKIAENLPSVKKFLKSTLDGINFLEAKSTTLQKIEILVTFRNI